VWTMPERRRRGGEKFAGLRPYSILSATLMSSGRDDRREVVLDGAVWACPAIGVTLRARPSSEKRCFQAC
jgi:hypothetical protein